MLHIFLVCKYLFVAYKIIVRFLLLQYEFPWHDNGFCYYGRNTTVSSFNTDLQLQCLRDICTASLPMLPKSLQTRVVCPTNYLKVTDKWRRDNNGCMLLAACVPPPTTWCTSRCGYQQTRQASNPSTSYPSTSGASCARSAPLSHLTR